MSRSIVKDWLVAVASLLMWIFAGDGVVNQALQGVIGDTIRYLKKHGKTVVYDAEHAFDGYKDDAIEKIGSHLAAGHFQGGKYNVYEGGTRTPLIARWTGRIPAGSASMFPYRVSSYAQARP